MKTTLTTILLIIGFAVYAQPTYNINQINSLDVNGIGDSIGVNCIFTRHRFRSELKKLRV